MTRRFTLNEAVSYLVLGAWSLIVIFPLWTMIVNSLKPSRDIFRAPYALPIPPTFEGYQNVLSRGRFDVYFRNSLFVTIASLALILALGALAAYGIARWRSRASRFLYVVFVAGLLIPIRLASVNIIHTVRALGLTDTLVGLIPVYVAMGIPIAILVLTSFIRAIPSDLIDSARIDGASELRIFLSIVVPLIRPAMATVAIFNLIPVWNDFWFPLILISSGDRKTVPLGVSLLFGQYQTNWTQILSALSLALLPIIILYLLMASQFIKGLTAGAVKG